MTLVHHTTCLNSSTINNQPFWVRSFSGAVLRSWSSVDIPLSLALESPPAMNNTVISSLHQSIPSLVYRNPLTLLSWLSSTSMSSLSKYCISSGLRGGRSLSWWEFNDYRILPYPNPFPVYRTLGWLSSSPPNILEAASDLSGVPCIVKPTAPATKGNQFQPVRFEFNEIDNQNPWLEISIAYREIP